MKIYSILIIILLAACNGPEICDCKPKWVEDGIYFEFDTTSSNGFSLSEIDTIQLFKLSKNYDILDSIQAEIINSKNGFSGNSRIFKNLGVFFDSENSFFSANFSNFNFEIKTQSEYSFLIDNIKLSGELRGDDDDCRCYKNTKKSISLNDSALSKIQLREKVILSK